MKIVLDVKKNTNTTSFKKNDIMFYDGKEWYVTSYDEVFKVLEDRYNIMISDLNKTVNQLQLDNQNFKNQINKELQEMSKIIKDYIVEVK